MPEIQCRICLQKTAYSFNIKDKILQWTICEIINKIADVTVSIDDSLPQSICTFCYDKVDLIVQFKAEVEQNDKILHQNDIKSCTIVKCEPEIEEENLEIEILEPIVKLTEVQKTRSGRIIKRKQIFSTKEDDEPKKVRIKQEKTEPKIELNEPELKEVPTKKRRKHFFQCCVCQELFKNVADLVSHADFLHSAIKLTNSEKEYPKNYRFECKNCKKKFRMRKSVAMHVADPSYEEPKKDRHEEYMRNKAKSAEKTKKEDEKVVCMFCGVIFSNRARQLEHELRAHAESFPFSCPHPGCEKRFAGEMIMKRHLYCHGEKKFSCSTCDKKFLKEKNLISHSFLHQEIKRYQCAHCPRTFTYRTVLKQHIESHMQLKVFPCTQCQKRYKWQSDLQKHIKYEHMNDAPYKCIFCTKGYFSSSSRKYHQERCVFRVNQA